MKTEYCPDYVGVACVDGTCPVANYEECAEHNREVAEEAVAQQAENLKGWEPVVHCKDCQFCLIERSPNGRHLCMRKVIRERVQLTDFCSHAVLIVRGENESR